MGMIELRWAVPENITTDQKILQFRHVREWPSPPGDWRTVPTEITDNIPEFSDSVMPKFTDRPRE